MLRVLQSGTLNSAKSSAITPQSSQSEAEQGTHTQAYMWSSLQWCSLRGLALDHIIKIFTSIQTVTTGLLVFKNISLCFISFLLSTIENAAFPKCFLSILHSVVSEQKGPGLGTSLQMIYFICAAETSWM